MNSWWNYGYITCVMCQYEYLISYSLDSWGMSSLKCTRSSYKVWRTLKAFEMNSWWNFGYITCAMFLYVDLVSCNRYLKWRANMPPPLGQNTTPDPGFFRVNYIPLDHKSEYRLFLFALLCYNGDKNIHFWTTVVQLIFLSCLQYPWIQFVL